MESVRFDAHEVNKHPNIKKKAVATINALRDKWFRVFVTIFAEYFK
jgi:hypothetical protein